MTKKVTNNLTGYTLPLSVGEFSVKLLRLQLKLCVRGATCVPLESSIGKHVSTIASKQLTNNSDDSPIKLYCNIFGIHY